MAAKQVLFGDDARAKIVQGVNILANAGPTHLIGIDHAAYRFGMTNP
ncbi:MAG: hypothetical protein M0P63_20540 [Azoarcus sp.]|nr:hypothetical protein [Azoarcus sp.]